MKSQFLKIAGVKTEKAFYKKYKTEEDFFSAHPEAKELVKKAQAGADLNNNYIPDYLEGPNATQAYGPQNQWNFGNNMSSTPSFGTPSLQQMAGNTFQTSNPFAMQNYGNQWAQNNPLPANDPNSKFSNGVFQEDKSVTSGLGTKDYKGSGDDFANKVPGIISGITGIVNSYNSEKKQKKELQKQNKLLKLTERLTENPDVNLPLQKHVLDSPENYIASTSSFYPSQGTGYDILRGVGRDGLNIKKAQDGINNFGPDYDIYSDGGYEPLEDSDNIKAYQGGGMFSGNYGGLNNMVGGMFGNNAGSQLSIIPGPFGVAAGMVGGMADDMFGPAGDIKSYTKLNQETTNRIIGNTMGQRVGFGANRKDGGYVSNDWTPQVIAKFGDHTAQDVYDFAHEGMDTLRSGGHLKDDEYSPVSQRGLPTFANGGDVTPYNLGETQVESGGYLKPISYNPHNDGTGWTSEIEGQYHHDYSPKLGHSGVIFNHGGNKVEAERGELIRHVQEGDSVDGDNLSANITGNLEYKPIFGEEDPKYKKYEGMKIKNIHKDIAYKDAALNKKQKQVSNLIANLSSDTKPDLLKQNALKAMADGIDQQYIINSEAADYFTNHQTKVNDYVDYMSKLHNKEYSHENFAKKGILTDKLAKGEISQKAKNGKTIKAAKGITTTDETTSAPLSDVQSTEALSYVPTGQHFENSRWGNVTDADIENLKKNNPWFDWDKFNPNNENDVKKFQEQFNVASSLTGSKSKLTVDGRLGQQTASAKVALKSKPTTTTPETTQAASSDYEPVEAPKKGFPWAEAASSLIRGLYPGYNMLLGDQINPELYALANNQVEGLYEPHVYSMLETPYKYSADKDRNAILSQARQAVKNSGNNPAAQAAIMAQVADSMNPIRAREQEINQQTEQGVYNRNIGTVNQDRARNFGIDMDAALKLAQAKSNTKAQTLAALESYESKKAQNRKENMEYNIGMAMHPDYTFGPDGRIIKLPRYIDFDTSGKNATASTSSKSLPGYKATSYDKNGNVLTWKKITSKDDSEDSEVSRDGKTIKKKNLNGNIVKAFKNL